MGSESSNHAHVMKPRENTLGTKAQVSFRLGDVQWVVSHGDAGREKLCLEPSQTLPCASLPLTGSHLPPLPVINMNHRTLHLFCELSHLRVVCGTFELIAGVRRGEHT